MPAAQIAIVLWCAVVAAGASAVATHYWCTHRRRPRVNLSARVATLDGRTTAILRAVDDLPLGEAHAVLWSVARLIDATAQVSPLWPDAAALSAGAAVERAAARAPAASARPRLVPPS